MYNKTRTKNRTDTQNMANRNQKALRELTRKSKIAANKKGGSALVYYTTNTGANPPPIAAMEHGPRAFLNIAAIQARKDLRPKMIPRVQRSDLPAAYAGFVAGQPPKPGAARPQQQSGFQRKTVFNAKTGVDTVGMRTEPAQQQERSAKKPQTTAKKNPFAAKK